MRGRRRGSGRLGRARRRRQIEVRQHRLFEDRRELLGLARAALLALGRFGLFAGAVVQAARSSDRVRRADTPPPGPASARSTASGSRACSRRAWRLGSRRRFRDRSGRTNTARASANAEPVTGSSSMPTPGQKKRDTKSYGLPSSAGAVTIKHALARPAHERVERGKVRLQFAHRGFVLDHDVGVFADERIRRSPRRRALREVVRRRPRRALLARQVERVAFRRLAHDQRAGVRVEHHDFEAGIDFARATSRRRRAWRGHRAALRSRA